ncbi:MAG: histidinol-phosphate aminotransferase [Parasphingorhabdus sp.]|jgi:histidinol-phosphate aminotransferase
MIPRQHLGLLKPYAIPEQPAQGLANIVRLDQNESYFGPSPHAIEAARQACESVWSYPQPDARDLRIALGKKHSVDPDTIVCGRGAMELIASLAQIYLEPGVNAVTSEFGYLFFKTAVKLSGAEIKVAAERDWRVDVDAMLSEVDEQTRIVFIANPGNPTGSYISKKDIVKLRSKLPDEVLLIIDEAYAEFVDETQYEPCFDLSTTSNTAVLRTFSKIHGMAGMRVGWGVFPQVVVNLLYVVQQPNPVNMPALAAAIAAVEDSQHPQWVFQQNLEIGNQFCEQLRELGFNPLASQTNFILIPFKDEQTVAEVDSLLRGQGIWVRGMAAYGLKDCFRITIGSAEDMNKTVECFKSWGQDNAQ